MAYISASVLGSYRDEQVFGCLEGKLILAGGMVEVSACICDKCVCLGFYYTPDVKNA